MENIHNMYFYYSSKYVILSISILKLKKRYIKGGIHYGNDNDPENFSICGRIR